MKHERDWLLRLAPRGEVALDRAASAAPTVAQTVAHVGEGPTRWAIEVGHDLATTIIREIPAFGGGDGPFETLRMGTESSTMRSLVLLAFPEAALVPITEEALEGDREFVRRNIALDKVLRGIRFGHAGMAHAFLVGCETLVDTARLADEMKAVSEDLFRFIDSFADAMVLEYLAERDRWVTSAAAARDETVRRILSEEPVDVRAASGVLGYELDRHHVAVTLWTEPGAPAGTSELQRVAVDVLHRRGATSTLVVPVGSSGLWAWGAVPRPEAPATAIERAASVRVACGLPGRGVDGFRRSHHEAVLAERLSRLAGDRAAWLTDYADVAAVALLAADLTRAGEFVRRELAGLGAPTDQAAVLRETLLHYLDAERSLATVSAELHVARGTVNYRIKRAEELLGREVGRRRFELHAALLLARLLGDVVLRSEP